MIAKKVNKKQITCYCNENESLLINKLLYQTLERHLKMANIDLLRVKNIQESEALRIDLKDIQGDDYYRTLYECINKLCPAEEIQAIIDDFHNIYKAITDTGQDVNQDRLPIRDDESDSKAILIFSLFKLSHLMRVITIIVLIISALTILLLIKPSSTNVTQYCSNQVKIHPIIEELEDLLIILQKQKFSSNNVDADQNKNNHRVIRHVEKILDYQNIKEVQEYFKCAVMSSNYLINYLYNIQAIATYYMYNMHEGSKSRELLLHAKLLAENYVKTHGKVECDFSKITNNEIAIELEIIEELPQLYTRIIYSLGRTCIYTRSFQEGIQYFETAKYLGKKYNLFEGYLSDISGILVVKKELAKQQIQNGQKEQVKPILIEIINKYDQLIKEEVIYIADYKPEAEKQRTITPSKEVYNLIECNSRIIESYAMLFSVSQDIKERESYLSAISKILLDLINDNRSFKLGQNISAKKVSGLYNILGDIMLMLGQEDNKEFCGLIKKHISVNNEISNIELAEILFQKSADNSRNSDYTKADAYFGLAKVYQKQLSLSADNLSSQQKQELQDQINIFLKKGQYINQQLNRHH